MIADTAWSIAVQARANNTCERCGKPSQIAHHQIHRDNQKARHDLKNGIALCHECHTWCHANPEKDRMMSEIIMLDRGDFMTIEGIIAWRQEMNK